MRDRRCSPRCGWAAALCALAMVALLRASLRAPAGARRRGGARAARRRSAPRCSALHGVVTDAAGARRVAAVELELRRAGLALDGPRRRAARPSCAGAGRAGRRARAAGRGGRRLAAAGRCARRRAARSTAPVRACSCEPTGCGSSRRSATSSSTRSSTAPDRCGSAAHAHARARPHRGARPGPGPAGSRRRAGGRRPARRPPRTRARDRGARGASATAAGSAHRAGRSAGAVRRCLELPRAGARRRAQRADCGPRRRRAAPAREPRAGAAPPSLLGLALVLGGLAASDVARREAALRAAARLRP